MSIEVRRLDLTAYAEVKVVRADSLAYESLGGWRVLAEFTQSVEDADGYGRERTVTRTYDAVHFVMGRDDKDALGAMQKRCDETDQKWSTTELARRALETQLKALQDQVTEGGAAKAALEQERLRANKMEADVATIRKAIGSERMTAILAKADDSIPF
jgi:septal ring factor EnvC (AmiA/AmiB activator)